MTNPIRMKIGAKAVRFRATSWEVRVVPRFAPKMIPRDAAKERMPALTSPNVMTVVAVLDWTTAVTSAPAAVPRTGVWVSRWMMIIRYSPAASWTSRENCSIPYRKRMMPGMIAKTSSHETIVWYSPITILYR